ncbi:MAG TPA: IPT/TIG domain-containing protein, partial [Planctomycetota bacterium]|nr:IPT/TIG domain-containing protein [Planctomycetota bacterium]
KYAWLGFDLANPTQPQFLEPVTNKELIVLRFRSRVGASEPGGFGSIAFVTNPTADQPTAFFPVEDVPGVPDMEAFIHGGIDILSDAEELVVASLSPARGALTGGNVVRVRGRGLPTDPADLESIELVSLAGDPIAADLDKVDFVSDEELRFVVPDSGLRSQTFFGRRVFNFRLTTSTGVVVLARSYTYEAPLINSSDVTSVRATQNDFVTLSGQGLAVGATAEFVVAGTTYLADIFRIEPDGSRLILVASQLPVPEPGQTIEADLRVHLPDGGTLSPPARFRILPPTEEPDFAVFSLEPSRAGYCGGTIVTVLGQGFTSGTKVTFGSAGEIGIELVNAREMRFVVPETDDVGPITVRISELGIPIDVAFILDPPVDFIRGDVNGDGAVAMEDATLLSQIVVGGAMPSSPDINRDAWDVTDDGAIDFGDSIWLLRYLFEGGAPPPAPFPEAGQDPDNRSDGICQ